MQFTLKLYIFFVRSCCFTFLITSKRVLCPCSNLRLCAVFCWGCLKIMDWDSCCSHEVYSSCKYFLKWVNIVECSLQLKITDQYDSCSWHVLQDAVPKLELLNGEFFNYYLILDSPHGCGNHSLWFSVHYLLLINYIAVYASASRDSVECIGVWLFLWGCIVLLTEYADSLFQWGQ